MLVYKALSDGLLLPWPDLSDAAQVGCTGETLSSLTRFSW